MRQNLRAWIRLLRLPAVLTVPGDVWVGAAVAGRTAEIREMAAVCLVYLFGMAFNDVWDRNRDAERRPERPIPSGLISERAAGLAALGLSGAALIAMPGTVPVILLLATVLLYTLMKTRFPLAGAVWMGLCRFQSVWIGTGAAVDLTLAQWAVPAGAGGIIFLITRLAQLEGEGKDRRGVWRSAWVAGAFSVAAVAGMWASVKTGPASWALLGVVAGVAVANHAGMEKSGRVPPSSVGVYLGMWIPLQAIWVLGAGMAVPGAVLVAFAVVHPWWSGRIAIS